MNTKRKWKKTPLPTEYGGNLVKQWEWYYQSLLRASCASDKSDWLYCELRELAAAPSCGFPLPRSAHARSQQHQFPSGRQRARGGSVWLWTCGSSECSPAPDARAGLLTSTATTSHELPTWSIRVESDLSVKSTGGDRDVLFTEESSILQVQVKAYLLDPHPRLDGVASWWLKTSSSLKLE